MHYSPLPRNLEAALRDLSDAKVPVRVSAAKDLVAHGDADRSRVVKALEKALSDAHPFVRTAAAEGLATLRASEALSALLIAVEDEHQLTRQTALLALGEIGDKRAQRRIERALKDERPEVRFQAVMAYPRVASSGPDILQALLAATRDEDESVAHIAFRMAEEAVGDEDGAIRDAAFLERARECLGHDSHKIRAVAAVVLGSASKADGDEIIVQLVEGRLAADPEDVAAAVELAGERKLEQTRPALERRAFGGFLGLRRDPFHFQARVALARMGDARAKKAILSELGSRSFDKRTLAVSAAGRARLVEAKGALVAMKGNAELAEPTAIEAALRLIERTEAKA